MIAKQSKLEGNLPDGLSPGAAAPPPRVKLLFLDGMRGLAALYVVLFHLYLPNGLPAALQHWLSWLRFGHYAVGVFIVLSGFSLMLPVVRSADGRISGSVADFFKRRARRILPPYYMAFTLSLALEELARRSSLGLSRATSQGDDADMVPGNIISHILLVHNWLPRWVYSVNITHWSVATEWQIYLLFPLLLLPVWRRWGNRGAVTAGLILGITPILVLPSASYWSCPQYVALFAMGMAAADISFSAAPRLASLRRRTNWGAAALLPFLGLILIAKFLSSGIQSNGEIQVAQAWTVDLLMGVAAAGTIVFCTKAVTQRSSAAPPLIVRMFEAPIATRLGLFSYSIYLVHVPLLWKVTSLLNRVHVLAPLRLVLMLVVGVPLTLAACYLFHLAFERRFMGRLSLPEKQKGEVFLSGRESREHGTRPQGLKDTPQ